MKRSLLSIAILISLVACSGEKVTPLINIKPLANNIEIHSDLVKEWYTQENYDYKDMNAFITAKKDQGDNLPIHFSWDVENLKEDEKVSYNVTFTDKNGYIESSYVVDNAEIDFINYKTNMKYNMNVAIMDGDNVRSEANYEFNTPQGLVRTITVDGVTNFRDLGDGVHMKQGLLYRSSTLANNTIDDENHPTSISELGKEQIKQLHFASRLDLRKEDEKGTSEPVVIKKVISTPLYYGGQNILTYKNSEYDNPETIKIIFTMLSDPSNYPCDIHCVRGTDRTGCIAYLFKGLLGFDEEALYRDYLFSNFYNIGSPVKLENIYYGTNPNATTKYVNVIHQAEGDTLQGKIYNYLLSDKIGVSKENLDRLIQFLKA